MEALALLICGLLTLGAAWFVAQPLLTGPGAGAGEDAGEPENPAHLLKVQKGIVYQTIHELDLDHAAGKLSDADYRALRAKQEAQAVDLLKAIDAATIPPSKTSPSKPSSPKPKSRSR